ncbi:ATP-binding protein [Pseudoxanthomonas koreensis]|uniref:ATP-binding protein n=1 Tax=Pseudoxanthomonas koreensis TaxID=266061 RepID=UPI00139109F9|nr:ATP-binding protein [Pseudoxanthomonas koreensis]KAF1697708.1 hybrid sensor histidine kinase/response regulator [Pseudoxanthomonas koreensis]
MAEAWTRLRGRLAQRPDSEHAQGLLRIGLVLLVLAYLLLPSTREGVDPARYATTVWIVLAGLTVGLALFAALLVSPGRSHARRLLGMVADYGLMAAAMTSLAGSLAWVYVLMLVVTVGNGLRYGTRYLGLAVAMALASFGSVLWLGDYWAQNRALGIGLLAGLAAVPVYMAVLLRQLTRATAEARRASEAKSLFLANMSHELRTPLNGLAGMSELLADTRLDREQREYVATLQASSRTLMALVEDVLDISVIEAGKVRLHSGDFSPRELVAGIGLVMQGQARARNLDYLVVVADEVPETVSGDAGHLRQVLLNLVGNAVKFTEQGRVRIDVSVLDEPADAAHVRLRFAVSDTGIGVPARMAGRLFDPFEQDDAGMARRYGGTGLGTSIARGLTEAMGGRIGYDSREGQGSCFWIEVPFARVDPASQPPLPAPVADEAGAAAAHDAGDNVIAFGDPLLRHRARVRSMRLLVADDNEDNRAVLQRLLQKAGHRATCVEGGEQALEALAATDYDAVIADLHMPGVSGLELMRRVRGAQGGRRMRLPVVILSADATPESRQRCERAGAFAFLVKPAAVGRLLETLSELAALRDRQAGGGAPAPAAATHVAAGVLDASVLDELAAMGMGATFEREFIAHCLADADGCIGAMSHAAEAADWARLRDHAHAIKGVAANLGLVRVAELGSGLMRLADWQVRNEWRQRLAMLNAALTQGREALDARLAARGVRDGGGEPG